MAAQQNDPLRPARTRVTMTMSTSDCEDDMRKIAMVVLAACGLVSLAVAADSLGAWQVLQDGRYKIFSGDTAAYGERLLPRIGSCPSW